VLAVVVGRAAAATASLALTLAVRFARRHGLLLGAFCPLLLGLLDALCGLLQGLLGLLGVALLQCLCRIGEVLRECRRSPRRVSRWLSAKVATRLLKKAKHVERNGGGASGLFFFGRSYLELRLSSAQMLR